MSEYTQNDLIALQNRKARLVQQYTSTSGQIDALFSTVQQQGFNTPQQFAELERLQRSLEVTEASMAEVDLEIFEVRLELDQYVPAGSPTQAPPTVSPAESPAAEQAEETANPLFPPPLQEGEVAIDPYGADEVTAGIDNVENPAPAPVFTDPNTIDIGAEAVEPIPVIEAEQVAINEQIESELIIGDGTAIAPDEDPNVGSLGEADDIALQNAIETEQRVDRTDDTGYPGEDPFQEEVFGANINRTPAAGVDPYGQDDEDEEDFPVTPPDPVPQVNSAALERLKSQAAIRATREPSIGKGDWRYRLQLAPNAPYFYNDPTNELLAPLRVTDGIIFPYTPRINTSYQARYTPYEPTHSNYKHYWYQGSHVGEINMDAEFTAQDTAEANYMLAVITFLKAASKMFYGQDADRGSPPPVLFLSGLGEYQFNQHPVVITQFNYDLPEDVNYIRANATQINGQAGTLQFRQNLATNNSSLPSSAIRTLINGLPPGAEIKNVSPSGANLGGNSPTYVPTKIRINILLLPVQSRREVSQEFSLQKYASGQLLQRGFW